MQHPVFFLKRRTCRAEHGFRHMTMLSRLACLICLAALLAPAGSPAAVPKRTIKPLPKSWQKGMNVAAFRYSDFSGDRYRYWIKRLQRQNHADTAMFATRWIQYWKDPLRGDDVAATDISPAYGDPATCRKRPRSDYTRCQTPTLAAERRAIRYAQSRGLKIAIKPLVDVGRDAGHATGREHINFEDPVQQGNWFASYRYMLAQYAALARDVRADLLVIGTGLTKMTDGPIEIAAWRQMIADIRSGELMGDGRGGFTGGLTYAARWDSVYKDVDDPGSHQFFWDDLSFIGVEGFWPLVDFKFGDHDNPTIKRLREGWTFNFIRGGKPPGVTLRSLFTEYQKPVILTGLGYLSRGGTSAKPSKGDYEQAASGGTVNNEAQERPVHAAFDFWGDVARNGGGWFQGIYWWNWLPKLGYVKNNGDYTMQGKPAEIELCLRHLGRMTKDCVRSPMPK